MSRISPHFVRGITRNLTYWQTQLEVLVGEQLYREHENILSAVQFGLGMPDTCTLAIELSLQVFRFVEKWGKWETWLGLLKKGVDDCLPLNVIVRVRVISRLGHLQRLMRQLDMAVQTHQNALALAQREEDGHLIAEIQLNLCMDYRWQQRYGEAERYGLAALEAFRQLTTNQRWLASTLNELGIINYSQGKPVLAEPYLHEAIEIWQQLGQATELGRSLNNLAMALQRQHQYETSLTMYQQALAQLTEASHELVRSQVYNSMGTLYFAMDLFHEAEAALRQADSIALRQSGDFRTRAALLLNLGKVLTEQGRLIEAERALQHSCTLWRQLNSELDLANTTGALAELKVLQEETVAAKAFYSEALALLASYPDHIWAKKLTQEFEEAKDVL